LPSLCLGVLFYYFYLSICPWIIFWI
jgi:hypothetical protein